MKGKETGEMNGPATDCGDFEGLEPAENLCCLVLTLDDLEALEACEDEGKASPA